MKRPRDVARRAAEQPVGPVRRRRRLRPARSPLRPPPIGRPPSTRARTHSGPAVAVGVDPVQPPPPPPPGHGTNPPAACTANSTAAVALPRFLPAPSNVRSRECVPRRAAAVAPCDRVAAAPCACASASCERARRRRPRPRRRVGRFFSSRRAAARPPPRTASPTRKTRPPALAAPVTVGAARRLSPAAPLHPTITGGTTTDGAVRAGPPPLRAGPSTARHATSAAAICPRTHIGIYESGDHMIIMTIITFFHLFYVQQPEFVVVVLTDLI